MNRKIVKKLFYINIPLFEEELGLKPGFGTVNGNTLFGLNLSKLDTILTNDILKCFSYYLQQ